ncbi:hypothetical protein T265_02063 [Opisthorchis viverrini]|uniref:Uncharacterized protein n=1 Tax=Opisthorchis viverrini TaxID=6198 RepID=A0A075A0R7_OPIVI|nr:hypothetical protein T265_02063 [Opisthorchis viverrini]KER31837.1 hypothetical protein T265_02063 [Opisthorchis viverrini]
MKTYEPDIKRVIFNRSLWKKGRIHKQCNRLKAQRHAYESRLIEHAKEQPNPICSYTNRALRKADNLPPLRDKTSYVMEDRLDPVSVILWHHSPSDYFNAASFGGRDLCKRKVPGLCVSSTGTVPPFGHFDPSHCRCFQMGNKKRLSVRVEDN